MASLYHITKERHLPKIFTEGLKINSKCTGIGLDLSEYKRAFGCQPIFLTNDVDYIINKQCGIKFFKRHKCKILEVVIDNIIIEWEYQYLLDKPNILFSDQTKQENHAKTIPRNTFVCKHNIKPEFLKIFE